MLKKINERLHNLSLTLLFHDVESTPRNVKFIYLLIYSNVIEYIKSIFKKHKSASFFPFVTHKIMTFSNDISIHTLNSSILFFKLY